MKKIVSLVLIMFILSSMMVTITANDSNNPYNIDYSVKPNSKAELEEDGNMHIFGWFDSYNVSSDLDWIMDGNIGVGGIGWTNLVDKKSETPLQHYSKVAVYGNSTVYHGTKSFGTGVVWASHNPDRGAMSDIRIFYGFE